LTNRLIDDFPDRCLLLFKFVKRLLDRFNLGRVGVRAVPNTCRFSPLWVRVFVILSRLGAHNLLAEKAEI